VSGPVRIGVAHHVWPGKIAVVFEGSSADTVAVFGPGGWEHGPRRLILPQGPPPGAASSFLALPQALVDQLAVQPFSGGALHTDFIFLDRLVRRLVPGTDDVVLLVLGRSPGALLCAGGRVTVIEPAATADEPLHMLLPSLSGWIVVISGKVSFKPSGARAPDPEAAASAAPSTPPAEPPRPQVRTPEPATPPSPPVPPATPAVTPAASAAADRQSPAGAFGRFSPESLFMLASGAAGQLPPEVTDRMAMIAGDRWQGLVGLLDGAHTLAQIAATTGLGAQQVAEIVDLLVASKLAFKYVSRARPQAGAPAGPR
jgi:hypothetical protein